MQIELVEFIQAAMHDDIRTYVIVELFSARDAQLVKLLTM